MDAYKYANTPLGQAFQKASIGSDDSEETITVPAESYIGDASDVISRRFKAIKIPAGEVNGYILYDRNTGKARVDVEVLGGKRPEDRRVAKGTSGWMMLKTGDSKVDTRALGSVLEKLNESLNVKLSDREQEVMASMIEQTIVGMAEAKDFAEEEARKRV